MGYNVMLYSWTLSVMLSQCIVQVIICPLACKKINNGDIATQ